MECNPCAWDCPHGTHATRSAIAGAHGPSSQILESLRGSFALGVFSIDVDGRTSGSPRLHHVRPFPPPPPLPRQASSLLFPGLNPVIPLGWGALAFIISLVIHELGHGLLARGHGMRIRSFGLLQLGPLPLGAFAEPQSDELLRAPRRERLRMFAAGPATNIFAAFVMFLLLGGLAGQFIASEDYIHVKGIVKDGGADEAGMQPWDTLISIDGQGVHDLDSFRVSLTSIHTNDTVDLVVRHENGERETLTATFGDKYDYYRELGWSEELLDSLDVEQGDPFLGVEGLSEGTAGIDRLAGPLSTALGRNTSFSVFFQSPSTSSPFFSYPLR